MNSSKKNYQSRNGLQGRHWKLALQDAVETWDKIEGSIYFTSLKNLLSFQKRRREALCLLAA